jgi:hypothetical protein
MSARPAGATLKRRSWHYGANAICARIPEIIPLNVGEGLFGLPEAKDYVSWLSALFVWSDI